MGFPRLFLIRTEAPILGVIAVRPADENQYSTRPNLMSSGRRGGNDQSILEMLERDTERGSHRRRGRSRLAWYGAGGTLAAGLIGLLAWLTHDSAPLQETQPIVVAETAAPADRSARLDPAAELLGLNELDDPPRPHHAAVIDEQLARQTRPITPVAMLTPPASPPAAQTAAAGKGALVQDEPSPRPGTSVAAAPHSQTGAAKHDAAKPQATRTALEPARARPSVKVAPSTARSAQRKLARNASRPRKATAAAQQKPAVDSDVALISAVIQHSSARPDGPCLEPNCAAKTTAQP
jgi:hypothetical protein